MKTKRFFAQTVLNELQNNPLNTDFRVPREQEVWFRMDAIMNELARASYFENWIFSGSSLDEQYITTWDGDNGIDVVDNDDLPSHIVLPASYVDLPRHGGIVEIWPLGFEEHETSVVIISHSDVRRYKYNKVSNMQGRLWGYPRGNMVVFGEPHVKDNYGDKMGVRLAIRDSSLIDLDAPYPIPADKEHEIISKLVEWFKIRKGESIDVVRDGNQKTVAL